MSRYLFHECDCIDEDCQKPFLPLFHLTVDTEPHWCGIFLKTESSNYRCGRAKKDRARAQGFEPSNDGVFGVPKQELGGRGGLEKRETFHLLLE
jgi:hypothetical protein